MICCQQNSFSQSFYICNDDFCLADIFWWDYKLNYILWSNYVSLASLSMLLLLDRVSSYSQADLKLGTLQMHISSLQLLRVSSLPLPQLRWKLAFQQLLLAFFLKANVRYASFFLFHRGKKLVRKDNQTESFLTWTLWMLTPTHIRKRGKMTRSLKQRSSSLVPSNGGRQLPF